MDRSMKYRLLSTKRAVSVDRMARDCLDILSYCALHYANILATLKIKMVYPG